MSEQWQKGTIGIVWKNVLNVLATSLYGNDPMCALRENLQNAHDACVEWGQQNAQMNLDLQDLEVDIIIDRDSMIENESGKKIRRPSLIIRDNGIGMTEEEIRDRLAMLGGSTKVGDSDVAATFENILSEHAQIQRQLAEEKIGKFGLGFLAGFIIADRIHVRSCKDGEVPVEAVFTHDTQFEFRKLQEPMQHGTEVQMFLLSKYTNAASPDNEEENLLDVDNLHKIINRYCGLLRFPFFLHRDAGQKNPPKNVTRNRPPWLDESPSVGAYERFLKERMPEANTPLLVIPIKIDETIQIGHEHHKCQANGLVYIPDPPREGRTPYGQTELYVRRMFVMEDKDELLPPWATYFCNAIIDTHTLTVTLDRNDVVRQDELYLQLRRRIGKQIIDGLVECAKDKPNDFKTLIERQDRRIRDAALTVENDAPSEFFQRIAKYLPVNIISREYPSPGINLSLEKYMEDHAQTMDGKGNGVKQILYFSHASRSMIQDLVAQKNRAVVDATDEVHKRFLQAYSLVDEDVVAVDIGSQKLTDYMADVPPSEAARWQPFCEFFKTLTHQGDQVQPEVKNFQPDAIPAIMLAVSGEDAENQREQLEEFLKKQGGPVGAIRQAVQAQLDLLPKDSKEKINYLFYLNSSNKFMRNLLKYYEDQKSTRLPTVVELILHELLHNARIYAGVPNSLDMSVHISNHHTLVLDELLTALDQQGNLEKQSKEFSDALAKFQMESAEELVHTQKEIEVLKGYLKHAILAYQAAGTNANDIPSEVVAEILNEAQQQATSE